MKKIYFYFLLIISFYSFSQEIDYPVLTEIVTDKASIFSDKELDILKKKLKSFEKNTTNQVVVLTINSLNNETIDDYALKTFETNKLGQKDVDNGVLILFTKYDKKVRIEVGYGLEHILTDVICSRIINNIMIPEFKDKDYFKGIDKATDIIVDFIDNPELINDFKEEKESTSFKVLASIFLTLFFLIFITIGFLLIAFFYKHILEAIRGFFIGKLSLFITIVMLFKNTFFLIFGLAFFIGPIAVLFHYFDLKPFKNLKIELDFLFNNIYIIPLIFLIISIFISVIRMFYYREKFKISLFKTDDRYYYKTFSSSGSSNSSSYSSSSYSSGSSSSSSRSSFSGGGGSSGGGGASGSW